jgi:hypothetical protein
MKYGNNSTDSIHKVIHAKATTTVHKYEPTVYDAPKEGPTLIKGHLEERFNGDINGEGVVETLQAGNKADKSSSFVGIERVTGKIGEKGGTFLLQVAGTVEDKIVKCEWFVIPGSGTTQLTGLRGEGGFQANLGGGGEVHLDYWFE